MFLLVSGRHVGAHLGGHQHGACIQISINLGKTFLRISSVRKIVACVAGGVRERVSGGRTTMLPRGQSPRGNLRAVKPRVN